MQINDCCFRRPGQHLGRQGLLLADRRLTVLITWEVFSRYALDHPHAWAFDAQIMMYGTLFMMAGAYTLAKNGHVRGDVLYGFFRPRTQATHRPDALHRLLHAGRRSR